MCRLLAYAAPHETTVARVIGEDPLERDAIGLVTVEQSLDARPDLVNAFGLTRARRALQHLDVLEGHASPLMRRDDPDPTSREAGINPDNAQRFDQSSPSSCACTSAVRSKFENTF